MLLWRYFKDVIHAEVSRLWEKLMALHNVGGYHLIKGLLSQTWGFPRKKEFCFQTGTWKSGNPAWVSNLPTQDGGINSYLGPQPTGLAYRSWTWQLPRSGEPIPWGPSPVAFASLENPNTEFFECFLFCVLYVWLLFLIIKSLRFIHAVEGPSSSCLHYIDISPVRGRLNSVQHSAIVNKAVVNKHYMVQWSHFWVYNHRQSKPDIRKIICTSTSVAGLLTKPRHGNNLSLHQWMNG